jgi:CheY-like chemotaxis protein
MTEDQDTSDFFDKGARMPSVRVRSLESPRHGSETEVLPAGLSVQAQAASRNILLVSDDDVERSLLRAYLRHVGFRVFSCASPAEAFRMIAGACHADLLLIDFHLLEGAGRSGRKSLAGRCPDLPLIAILRTTMLGGALCEIKHCVWEPHAQPFVLPELLGRIQESLNKDPEAKKDQAKPARPGDARKVVAFPGRGPSRIKQSSRSMTGNASRFGEEGFDDRKRSGANFNHRR